MRARYALFPLGGFPASRLPLWEGSEARILAAPALGAAFAEYLLDLAAGASGQQPVDGRCETFYYVVSGAVRLSVDGGSPVTVAAGGYALVPYTSGSRVAADAPARLLMLRKAYEVAPGFAAPPLLIGNVADVAPAPFLGDDGARLQLLVPDDPRYDLAMNVFAFDPGHGLPYVETHVMEHGLYFLQGRGVYFLDDAWMEVEETDFIWMGPFVPQSFYATGTGPAKYLYYKNVNRDVAL